jgi:ubiquitin carboxyl-terminal hydrolase 5/13
MMGIPENAAKHALYNTGNNSADMAATWYFEHMDDPGNFHYLLNSIVLNEPLIIKKAGGGGDGIPQELVDSLASMGFPDKRVRKALKACVSTFSVTMIG